MAQIEIKFDNTLEQSPIVIPLANATSDELGEPDATMGTAKNIKQTSVYGVVAPLIRIGDIVVDIDDIIYAELNGTGHRPTLKLTVQDSQGTIKGLQNPGSDNEVRFQILPKFENAYKKIDLTFHIVSYSADGDTLYFDCIYKVLDLYNSRVKCFGETTTYELFETIAKECKLGFATNVEASTDTRYIYCANQSYNEIMAKSIETSGDSGNDINSRIMYNYWIDFWNNINFVDEYERFNTVDSDDDMMIYVSAGAADVTIQNIDEEMYIRTPAVLSNDPAHAETELFIGEYNPVNNSTKANKGSDRVMTTYNILKGEALDYLLQDGDQQNDIFTKHEYLGECYREFDYLLASSCREMMEDKMKDEVLEVTVNSPLLALMRGSKVNLRWFDTNNRLNLTKQKLGIKDSDIESNIPIDSPEDKVEDNPNPLFRINKQISGQYYILNSVVRYENGKWSNTIQITRPRDKKEKYLDLSEETKSITAE